jgi:predicted dehydrogenase
MTNKVRVGIIGCGGIAISSHMTHLSQIPEAEIVGLADTNPEQIKLTKERRPELVDVPGFSTHQEMLEKVPMDAVVIATPHTMHYSQIKDAFDAGMHILCEKPMVCTVQDANEVISWFNSDPKRIGVIGYQRRYSGLFRYMRDSIAAGDLGKVQYVSVLQCQEWLNISNNTWRSDPALSGGGQLNDSGSHVMDILLWLTGLKPKKVSAYTDNLTAKVDINSVVSVVFDNGALGNISICGNAPQFHEAFTVVGDKGCFYFDMSQPLKFADAQGNLTEITKFPEGTSSTSNFIMAILGREEVGSPVQGFLPVITLTEAIWNSAAQGGKPVEV